MVSPPKINIANTTNIVLNEVLKVRPRVEFNAILNTRNGSALSGCKIYVTLFTCNECAKAIVQVGIKEVIYLDDKYHDSTETTASRKILDMAGVSYKPYKGRKLIINVGQ